jgi:protein-S-isoprenylcysteine O-methyltransferase Ste14
MLQLDATIGESLDPILTYAGALLFMAGALLAFSGAYYLVRRGEGTPLPLDPPHRMVVAGPYAYIQHPIMLGVITMAVGEALWVHSPSLGMYALLLTVLINLYVVYIEEPNLEKRFGEDYRAYRAATPRWLPFRRSKA